MPALRSWVPDSAQREFPVRGLSLKPEQILSSEHYKVLGSPDREGLAVIQSPFQLAKYHAAKLI
jgi:hypothetical protein